MPISRTILVGAGGHARVVLDALLLESALQAENLYATDDRQQMHGTTLMGVKVIGPILDTVVTGDSIIPAIGNNVVRARITDALLTRGAILSTVIHPRACVSRSSEISAGCFIAAQAIVAPAASVGRAAIVNHACVVDHECVVGPYAHIAPGSILGGACFVGERTLIGAGAIVLPGLRIGADCIVGAGAVVTKSVPNNTVVVGMPAARLVKPI